MNYRISNLKSNSNKIHFDLNKCLFSKLMEHSQHQLTKIHLCRLNKIKQCIESNFLNIEHKFHLKVSKIQKNMMYIKEASRLPLNLLKIKCLLQVSNLNTLVNNLNIYFESNQRSLLKYRILNSIFSYPCLVFLNQCSLCIVNSLILVYCSIYLKKQGLLSNLNILKILKIIISTIMGNFSKFNFEGPSIDPEDIIQE